MNLTGLGVTAGYHRLFSHLTYKANNLTKIILLFFGAMALQNSALTWSADHRLHHQKTDLTKDPYNFKKGFWYAHWYWIFWDVPGGLDYSIVADLKKEPLIMWQHKYYWLIAFVGNIILGKTSLYLRRFCVLQRQQDLY